MDKNIENINEMSLKTYEEIEDQNIALKKIFDKITSNNNDSLVDEENFLEENEFSQNDFKNNS
ncbi:MAG: hypothetical protein JXL97_00835 [Bacteroidales bacterium]|nr:hypothetical protein [Bacteroidales bacterium]